MHVSHTVHRRSLERSRRFSESQGPRKLSDLDFRKEKEGERCSNSVPTLKTLYFER